MSIFIRKTIVGMHGDIGLRAKILYGGSLNATNAPAMLREGDIHGLLIGRASWDAVGFAHLLEAVKNA
jgi:triosephosphate isomerase